MSPSKELQKKYFLCFHLGKKKLGLQIEVFFRTDGIKDFGRNEGFFNAMFHNCFLAGLLFMSLGKHKLTFREENNKNDVKKILLYYRRNGNMNRTYVGIVHFKI